MTDSTLQNPLHNDLEGGTIAIYDYLRPALTSGDYQIEVSHEVVGITDALVPTVRQPFVVTGPGYSLPAGEVHAVYPPDGSSGPYALTLPHVVLTTRTLPWERALEGPLEGPLKDAPWLALLVFSPAELASSSGQSNDVTSPLGSKMMPVAEVTTPREGAKIAVPSGKTLPEVEPGTCQIIEVPIATFLDVVPQGQDLPLVAHVRQVSRTKHSSAAQDAQDDGFFAVVVANRLPAPGANLVHLVSLAGHENLLSSQKPDPSITQVRLVSLAAWSFTVTHAANETFAGLGSALVHARHGEREDLALGLPYDKDALKLPTSVPRQRAATRLKHGYVPLDHRLPTNERTFSWYRGPLTPAPVAPIDQARPFVDADSALILDTADGVLDISLATAWSLGRSLALADQDFAVAVVRLRRTLYRLGQKLLGSVQSGLVTLQDLDAMPPDRLRQRLVEQHLLDQLRQGLGENVAQPSRQGIPPPSGAGLPVDPQAATPEFLDNPTVQQFLANAVADSVEPVARWLAGLMLLRGVPFSYLAPHPDLLPPESIRFFSLDSTWTDAAMAGALRIGRAAGSSRDAWSHRLITTLAPAAARRLLASPDGATSPPADADAQPPALSGLLLRSALVSGWPRLLVESLKGEAALQTVRSDRLAPDLLLCLFAGTPDTVRLTVPSQTLHFQVNDKASSSSRVLDLAELATKAPAINGGKNGSAALAMHLLAPTEQVVFTLK